MCHNSCNECPRKIFSTGVSVITVDTEATLVIDIPAQTFNNCQKGCLVIIQTIPTETTINAPVAISIGGDTTTLYPVTNCRGAQISAAQLRTRKRYPFKVITTPTSGVFSIQRNLSCAPDNNLLTIPVAETTTGG